MIGTTRGNIEIFIQHSTSTTIITQIQGDMSIQREKYELTALGR